MQDRRKNARTRTYLGGVLAFQGRCATLDCTIRNLRDGGARITAEGSVILPEEFDLAVTRNDRAYRARLIWRSATEAGVALLDAAASGVVTLDVARKLSARDRENAR